MQSDQLERERLMATNQKEKERGVEKEKGVEEEEEVEGSVEISAIGLMEQDEKEKEKEGKVGNDLTFVSSLTFAEMILKVNSDKLDNDRIQSADTTIAGNSDEVVNAAAVPLFYNPLTLVVKGNVHNAELSLLRREGPYACLLITNSSVELLSFSSSFTLSFILPFFLFLPSSFFLLPSSFTYSVLVSLPAFLFSFLHSFLSSLSSFHPSFPSLSIFLPSFLVFLPS